MLLDKYSLSDFVKDGLTAIYIDSNTNAWNPLYETASAVKKKKKWNGKCNVRSIYEVFIITKIQIGRHKSCNGIKYKFIGWKLEVSRITDVTTTKETQRNHKHKDATEITK